jgi:polysaccharide pyruvyl transferase WcaK-like protein
VDVPSRPLRNPLARFVRKVFVGIPRELYRWFKGFSALRGTDALIVPGTGLLNDAYTFFNWGPYDMFRWSVTAKVCGCKLLFVSVGAGPLYSRVGRFFVKAALFLADFRSYRDESTLQYLRGIGFPADGDRVYPDLAFSLPENVTTRGRNSNSRRLVVGLGLMEYAGRYSVERPTSIVYPAYLETLVEFVKWLLAHDYNIRLLIGDLADARITREFKSLLKERFVSYEDGRLIQEPIESVEDLLPQLAATDLVVATRFHNVLLSLLLNKPAIAISFHHKCSSLMSQMGLAEYCQDINTVSAARLIDRFCHLQENANCVKQILREKVEACRDALDEQYGIILREIYPAIDVVTPTVIEAKSSRKNSVLS